MRGRVNSTVILAATGLAALAPLTAGLLVEHFSGTWAMLAFAAIVGVAAIMSVTLPGLRQAEAAHELAANDGAAASASG
jgi:MFS family permease